MSVNPTFAKWVLTNKFRPNCKDCLDGNTVLWNDVFAAVLAEELRFAQVQQRAAGVTGEYMSRQISWMSANSRPLRTCTQLTFQGAQLLLLAHVRGLIRNGELTERAFARQIGISQSHAHNALKGVRNLSPEILDAILKYFHLSLLDLAWPHPPEVCLEERKYPTAFDQLPETAPRDFPASSPTLWAGGCE